MLNECRRTPEGGPEPLWEVSMLATSPVARPSKITIRVLDPIDLRADLGTRSSDDGRRTTKSVA